MSLDDRIPGLLARVDLVALVARCGGAEAKRSGATVTFHCPSSAHEDRSPSFTVKDGRWKCWSVCAAGGDAIDFLTWLKGCTKAEAIDELSAIVGLDRPAPTSSTGADVDPRATLVRWCRRRAWGPWVIDELGLTVVEDGYGKPRVRFPFRLGDQVPYWQDRAISDRVSLRWLSPSKRQPIPYEADRLQLARDRGHVFVVEGVTDAVALVDVYLSPAVVGIPGVSAWRTSWAAAFAGLGVYVVADNDDAGRGFRARLGTDLAPVARSVHQVEVPTEHNDLAAWRQGLDAEHFDAQLMAAVEATAGHRVEMAG